MRRQMAKLIDRTRYPVLITYSDEGQGHTGHVYKCSGWQKTAVNEAVYYEDGNGVRISPYSDGAMRNDLIRAGVTNITRWEHWICERGDALEYAKSHGWRRVPLKNKNGSKKVWKSGKQAYGWILKKKNKTARLNMRLTEDQQSQLERLMEVSDSASLTETVRRALDAYGQLWDAKKVVLHSADGKSRKMKLN